LRTQSFLLLSFLVGAGCSDRLGSPDVVGAVGVQLQLAPDVNIAAVSYGVTGNGVTRQATVPLAVGGATFSFVVDRLPAGDGYAISLTATSLDGHTSCSGGPTTFRVVSGTESSVLVRLQCRGDQARTGSVLVNGSLNVCPVIDVTTAVPLSVAVGGTIQLAGAATDRDGAPSALTYHWAASAGAIAEPTAARTTFTAGAPGAVTVTLTVSDGDCQDQWSLPLTVTEALPDAGADGGFKDQRPNILLIVADDLGYSDLGAFGGEIKTPNLDTLAAEGRILADHHTGATCAPTRSMLISGTDHHLVGLGAMGAVGAQVGEPGYENFLNDKALSVAELLHDGGYHTYIAGKWHLGSADNQTPRNWGYESSYVLLGGVSTHFAELSTPPTLAQQRAYRENGAYVTPPADFYSTNFYTDKLISYVDAHRGDGKPFYAFAAYTSPHWPMQAPDDFRDRYRGRYDEGWDVIRARRIARQKQLGIIPQDFTPYPTLPARPSLPAWADLTAAQRADYARRMEIYAAMVENLDYNIGRLFQYLKRTGQYENTFIFFQADNGPEGANMDNKAANNSPDNLGKAGSYVSYQARWAEVSSAPFRLWKQFASEGGVSAPAIARLPGDHAGHPKFASLTHVTDLAPTFLELAGVADPGTQYKGRTVHPITGTSILPALDGRSSSVRSPGAVLADELFGNRYVIRDNWKLLWLGPSAPLGTSDWSLHDLSTDRGESIDVSGAHPEIRSSLVEEWNRYVVKNGVIVVVGGYGGFQEPTQ
jgi:arylsulfatase A-like enzyme